MPNVVVMPSAEPERMNADEFLRVYGDEDRMELIDGVVTHLPGTAKSARTSRRTSATSFTITASAALRSTTPSSAPNPTPFAGRIWSS